MISENIARKGEQITGDSIFNLEGIFKKELGRDFQSRYHTPSVYVRKSCSTSGP